MEVGVGVEVVKEDDLDARILQYGRRPTGVPAGDQPRVGHEKCPAKSQFESQVPESCEGAFREDDGGPGVKIEGFQAGIRRLFCIIAQKAL
jgi:hypothetical protein